MGKDLASPGCIGSDVLIPFAGVQKEIEAELFSCGEFCSRSNAQRFEAVIFLHGSRICRLVSTINESPMIVLKTRLWFRDSFAFLISCWRANAKEVVVFGYPISSQVGK